MKTSILFILILTVNPLFAQNNRIHTITFHPVMGNFSFQLNKNYSKLNTTDSFQIQSLKFYVSGIELFNNSQRKWMEPKSFHLIDATDSNSMTLQLNIPDTLSYNKIRFYLGIDSTTSISGAMDGDLDPTKGMYWAWQSGYINFKIEGKSNQCKTRNNEFQFHLGGYQYPFNAMQTVYLDFFQQGKTSIYLDVESFISEIDLSKQHHIMSPGKAAVTLSEKIVQSFSVKQP